MVSIRQGLGDVAGDIHYYGSMPLRISDHGVVLKDSMDIKRLYPFEGGIGAIYVAPLPNERLELVTWGYDEEGLRQAARFVPMLTGVGQPDFIIVRRKCAWQGAAGVLAMGFFDHNWKVTQGSYLT